MHVFYTAFSKRMERVPNSAVIRLKKYITTISRRMAQHYVKYNEARESPRKGLDGGIPHNIFKILLQA